MGTLEVPTKGGHRIWVDDHVIGESPGTFTVRCGARAIRVGSQGTVQHVTVPCGGDVEVR
jgi:hypothetical protein